MKITKDIYPNKDNWDNDFELQVMCDNLEIKKGMKTLDLGCFDSNLSDVLSDLDCEAWGVDLRRYHNAKFKFIQQDFLKTELPENYFDAIIDVSAIHHFGIGFLDELPKSERIIDINADIKSAEKVYKLLKPYGLFYVSTDRFELKYKILEGKGRQHVLKSFLERIAKYFEVLEIKYYIPHFHPLKCYNTTEEAESKGAQLFVKMQKIEW